jgi:putative addiction module CopG family antidote
MIPVSAMSITLTPDLAKLVQQEMATGRYGSENDLLFIAVQLLSERRRQMDAVRRELQPALDSLDRGEGEPLNMDHVRDLVRQCIADQRPQHVGD